MAPTPYAAGWQLDIHYTVSGLSHVIQLPCFSPSAATPYSLALSIGGSRLASLCAADFVALLKPNYHSSVVFTGYSLQEVVDGIFIPRESASMSVAGTGATASVLASQIICTFRDLPYKVYRLYLAETIYQAPGRVDYPTGEASFDNFIESLLPGSVATNPPGLWLRSRGGNQIVTFTGGANGFNKTYRRARGYL